MPKAKPTYAKLKLTSEVAPKEFTWGDQVIEVKQYISIQDKLQLVSEVINAAADENRFANWGKLNMYLDLKILEYYTNLSITDKQKENAIKMYDEIVASGFKEQLQENMDEFELNKIYSLLHSTVEDIYNYQNSAYGILDSLNTDYSNLNFDIEKLTKEIGNKENVQFLDQVLTKLG